VAWVVGAHTNEVGESRGEPVAGTLLTHTTVNVSGAVLVPGRGAEFEGGVAAVGADTNVRLCTILTSRNGARLNALRSVATKTTYVKLSGSK